MANTTWNPSDKSAGITLSGGNLVATNNNNAISGVRAVDRQITGKFYWEITFTTTTFGANATGVINSSFALASVLSSVATGAPILGIGASGQINGGFIGPSPGAVTSGGTVCLAVDCAQGLLWIRTGAAGNWNASASANPATGVGGLNILSIGLGRISPLYPWMMVGNTNDRMTANFGDAAFLGAVPSGFASGFTAGAVIPTSSVVTQAAVEQWGQGAPAAQVTQAALEVWGGITAGARSALVTQLAIEQWAPVAVPPPTARQYSVTVNSS